MTAVVTGEMPPPPIAVTMRLRPEANLVAADSNKLLAHGIATCMLLG